MAHGQLAGPSRSPMNDHQTMLSTAEEMVRWYQGALKGEFFRKPETLLEFKRIQAMADSLWHVVPADTLAYGKGGSIDWQDFPLLRIVRADDGSWGAGDVLFHDQLDRPGGRRTFGLRGLQELSSRGAERSRKGCRLASLGDKRRPREPPRTAPETYVLREQPAVSDTRPA